MNLATKYLGLDLCSPFVVGASPFCDSAYLAKQLQDFGAGALVMRSLFEEQIEGQLHPSLYPLAGGCGLTDFPEVADYQLSPESYLRQVAYLKQNVSIPIIASLNGTQPGNWTDYAARLEGAGADAIELNFYRVVTDVAVAADQIEAEMLVTLGVIAGSVNIPVAVKLSPFHTALAQLVVALELEGAAGIVLFNRFYQPDIDTAKIEVRTQLRLSSPEDILLRLRWLAILSPNLRGSLAATGGFHTADDIVKALLTGAHTVQLVSALLRHGPAILEKLGAGLRDWMSAQGYRTIDEFRGRLNLKECPDASAYERANYIRTLQSWTA